MSLKDLRGNWNYPTDIRFGVDRILELPAVCREINIARPLLVTDHNLASVPMIRDAVDNCNASGLHCRVFSGVQGNPTKANVTCGVDAYKSNGHDGIIGFGGGSALDVGKAIALMVGQKRSLWDFEDREDWFKRANVAGMSRVIAVPTTSGTGSEVGRAAVITDEDEHVKKIIYHPNMMPVRVIADPTLTTGLSSELTAAVGMDALSHNLEAFSSPVYHPMAHGIALEGTKLIMQWLVRACKDGEDLEARAHMQVASTMGATAFQKGLGAMHSMSHPCGALLNTHHGLTNAVVMPYVLLFNRPAIDANISQMATYLGIKTGDFAGVLDWILTLRDVIGIPNTLSELGVAETHISTLSSSAAIDPSAATNPVSLDEKKLDILFRQAINGRLG